MGTSQEDSHLEHRGMVARDGTPHFRAAELEKALLHILKYLVLQLYASEI